LKHKNSSRRSIGILLGLGATGLGMQACSGDSTSSTSTTGGDGGAPATTSTAAATTSSAGGASSASTTVGVGGAGGSGGGGAGGATSSSASSSSASAGGSASSAGSSASSASSSASSSSTSSASSSSTSSASAGSSSSSTGSSSSSASTGTGGGVVCTEISLAALKFLSGDGSYARYASIVAPNLGDPTSIDKLLVEFYGSSLNPIFDGELKGTFDLSAGSDDNYATCSRCLIVYEDLSGTTKFFFQKSGSLVIDATSDQVNGTVKATINNLTLVEVTIDPSGTSTPVPGGACRHLTTAAVMAAPPVAPGAWSCDPTFYGDGGCDCGCGVVDFDCDDATLGTCEYCDDTGSCSADSCPGTINPINNAVCGVL